MGKTVSFNEIREYMETQAEEDRKRNYVTVTADSLDDALNQASVELGVPIKKIEYEIIEKGAKGLLGMGKKSFLIMAYTAREESEVSEEDIGIDFGTLGGGSEEAVTDGKAAVRFSTDGILLKVTKPSRGGKKVDERDAMDRLLERLGTTDPVDTSLVSKTVKQAQGEFIKVGDFEHNPANDAMVTVDITDMEMKAYLNATPPGKGGTDPEYDYIITFLQNNNVVEGIKEDEIRSFIENPVYGEPILAAEGKAPENGADARVAYNFETDKSKVKLKEKDGKVDFKELNIITNVVEGQVVARKIPAERGKSGRTVTGKLLPATDGKDVNINAGKNVAVSEDGTVATAELNGQVVIQAGKINVEPIYVVQGDVNLKTGNILFLGTVIVKGNVEDGFSVKASGNIEVMGSVGRCELDAEGDIVVHQGIAGKNSGIVQAGQTVWSKFIENTRVEAGELVVVSDGIINSEVFSDKKIICKGKRANIVGGKLRAASEINANALGSVAGMETILEVGYDPKIKEQMLKLDTEREELTKELDEINLNLSTIQSAVKKTKKKLSPDKKEALDRMLKRAKEISARISEIDTDREEKKQYLSQLQMDGRISASGKVYPGVKISIKDAFLEVRNEFKSVTFISEAGNVKISKYIESEEDTDLIRKD
ncbi:MAG: FapA family protein [Spirochaetia bacterium]